MQAEETGLDLAMVSLPDSETQSMLRATLTASDHGILITGLDRQILAVNRRFGELFDVDPAEALTLGLEQLRERVFPVVRNAQEWLQRTSAIYDDPNQELEDEIELFRGKRLVIHRFTSPVHDGHGRLIGRVWTYRDITKERRQSEMNDILVRLSSEFIPDPAQSLRKIVKELKVYYGQTSCILSIRNGDCMLFRAMETDSALLATLPQNRLQDAYCQFVLRLLRPIIVQDARLHPEYHELPALRFGQTRYLGAPIFGESSQPLGTLCIMDSRSQETLDELDLNFLSFLAVRVSAELARERYAEQRLAEHRLQAEKQRTDLAATHSVLDTMNSLFGLIWSGVDLGNLLQSQVRLMAGILGFRAVAVGVRRLGESSFRGRYLASRGRSPQRFELQRGEIELPQSEEMRELESPNHELAKLLQSQVVSFAIRHEEGVGDLLVAFGGDTSPVDPIRRRILLTALARQACLVIVTYILQKDLDQASRKLGEAQEHLLEKEKLAVVGTLAASTAHDIRNILASLSLLISSEQERSGPESGSQKDDNGLTAIREQIRRFDVLAHRLLSYAKPQMIVTQPVELPKVIDSVLAVTAGHFRVGKITLLRSVQKNLPRVAGDPHEYEHLLVNLVLNGVQSMNNSGGSLRINVKRKGSTVSVSVSDTGSGLSDEIKDRLFEPFASTRSDGFGLGLFSCRRIVEHHGGAISARRNPQKGTTFTVLLPVYGE